MAAKITEHEMLVTLATMAVKMDDLTGHDVIEALIELGYGDVVREARRATKRRTKLRSETREGDAFTRGVAWAAAFSSRFHVDAKILLKEAGIRSVSALRDAGVTEEEIDDLSGFLNKP